MTSMTKERDKRIFTGILVILLVIICIAGYVTESRIKNVMGNELVLRHVDIQRNIPIYCCRFLV